MRVLTFDVEDWFHLLDVDSTRSPATWGGYEARVEGNTERILELLQRNRLRATFFVLGWVAEKYPRLVRRISDAGFEVGSHSHFHQLAYTLRPAEFKEDLKRSIAVLESVTGRKVRSFRCPGFSVTEENLWILDMLIGQGISYDSSIFPARRAHGGLPSFGKAEPALLVTRSGTLKEFPINTYRLGARDIVFSGGGYFRLVPYFILRKMMRRSPYVMSYFHPRDFDRGQPVVPGLGMGRRFKSYVGLGTAFSKLERLLAEFEFVDLARAEALVDWASARRIPLEAG